MSPAEDLGPRAGATGQAFQVVPGRYRYTVAAGDAVIDIVARFGICYSDLYLANPALDGQESDLQVGEQLAITREKHAEDSPAQCRNLDNDTGN